MASEVAISIVIPVYNAAPYLSQCLESIINQDIELPFEIVCVNDGSQDNSLNILKDYSSKYSFIKIFDKPNGGVSSTRKLGVQKSQGEWIVFVDADDKLPEKALSSLLGGNRESHDIIIGEFFQETTPKLIPIELYRENIIKRKIHSSIWAKAFRRELFTDQIMEIPREIKLGEDLLLNIRLSFTTNKPVLSVGKSVYIYNRVPTSLSHTFKQSPDYEERFQKLIEYSIPSNFKTDKRYVFAWISLKINAWKDMNLFKLSTKSLRQTNFYRELKNEIGENKYPLKIKEWIQINGNSFPWRLIAVSLNIGHILKFKLRRSLWKLK